uniref:Uncharacterized protein n=1 Tax=Romanomermis culicivorax TaxID=13658 RepID=A0A915IGM2_ROMCU
MIEEMTNEKKMKREEQVVMDEHDTVVEKTVAFIFVAVCQAIKGGRGGGGKGGGGGKRGSGASSGRQSGGYRRSGPNQSTDTNSTLGSFGMNFNKKLIATKPFMIQMRTIAMTVLNVWAIKLARVHQCSNLKHGPTATSRDKASLIPKNYFKCDVDCRRNTINSQCGSDAAETLLQFYHRVITAAKVAVKSGFVMEYILAQYILTQYIVMQYILTPVYLVHYVLSKSLSDVQLSTKIVVSLKKEWCNKIRLIFIERKLGKELLVIAIPGAPRIMPFQSLKQEVKKNLSSCTIAGVNFYCRQRKATHTTMWYFLTVIALIGCISLCRKGYLEYVEYSVRTNVHLNVPIKSSSMMENIRIPNLSFCQYKTIKTNVYHNDQLAREFALKMVSAYAPHNNETQYRKGREKYCPPADVNEKPAELIDFQAFVKADNLYNELIEVASKIWTSRRDMVLQCSWKGLNFPCNASSNPVMLTDSYTDDGLCFTFEHNVEWIRNISNDISISLLKSFKKSRPHDLSLIFDIKQYQRCGPPDHDKGEGFFVTAFDRRTLAQTNMVQSSSFNIHPGYEYKLRIKTVLNTRLTENLNRCTSRSYLPTDEKTELLVYTKGTCQGILLLKWLVEKCNCLPPIPQWFAAYVNEKNTGLNYDAVKHCSDSMAGLACLTQNFFSGTRRLLGTDNRHCMDPCEEPTYKSIMYAKNRLTETFVKSLNIPLIIGTQVVNDSNIHGWIKKNIIVLHVDFESDTFEKLTEIQLFTFIDLLRFLQNKAAFMKIDEKNRKTKARNRI